MVYIEFYFIRQVKVDRALSLPQNINLTKFVSIKLSLYDIAQILLNNQFHEIDSVSDQKSLLLSLSRFPGFIELCCFAMNDVSGYLLTEVKI